MATDALINEWAEQARELGRQHGSGLGSDDNPLDAIDLQAWSDLTGEGMSMGEMIEVQAIVQDAYDEGLKENDNDGDN